MQRWAAGAPSLDVAIPAEPIRCLGRVLWGKQKRGLDSVWTRETDAMQSRTFVFLAVRGPKLCDSDTRR